MKDLFISRSNSKANQRLCWRRRKHWWSKMLIIVPENLWERGLYYMLYMVNAVNCIVMQNPLLCGSSFNTYSKMHLDSHVTWMFWGITTRHGLLYLNAFGMTIRQECMQLKSYWVVFFQNGKLSQPQHWVEMRHRSTR